ncbi:MAG: hypothetical protein E6Y10_03395 [Anaerococcus sp.]|nr:hypothetical protein [Anaerococcus sp.]
MSKFSDKDEIIKFFRENYPNLKLFLTLGPKGSIYFDKNQIINQKPYKVKAIDTTGLEIPLWATLWVYILMGIQ